VLCAARKTVVFSWDLNELGESIEHRLGEFHTDGPHREKAHDVKLAGRHHHHHHHHQYVSL